MKHRMKAPSMKDPRPVRDIITLGRCLKCGALMTGPRPSPRVERIYITCPVCSMPQIIERRVVDP